jgi:hypothetical protein
MESLTSTSVQTLRARLSRRMRAVYRSLRPGILCGMDAWNGECRVVTRKSGFIFVCFFELGNLLDSPTPWKPLESTVAGPCLAASSSNPLNSLLRPSPSLFSSPQTSHNPRTTTLLPTFKTSCSSQSFPSKSPSYPSNPHTNEVSFYPAIHFQLPPPTYTTTIYRDTKDDIC